MCLAAWAIVQAWQSINVRQFGLLAASSTFWSCGYFLIAAAMRAGQLGVVAPFRYSALIYSSILGYVIWHDVPNSLAWSGMTLIAVSGMCVIRAAK